MVPALQARLKRSNKKLPQRLVRGDDHTTIEVLIDRALSCTDEGVRLGQLKELAATLDQHLKAEEDTVMPLLLERFTFQELCALDSFVVNPKLGWCDEETLVDIAKWWVSSLACLFAFH